MVCAALWIPLCCVICCCVHYYVLQPSCDKSRESSYCYFCRTLDESATRFLFWSTPQCPGLTFRIWLYFIFSWAGFILVGFVCTFDFGEWQPFVEDSWEFTANY